MDTHPTASNGTIGRTMSGPDRRARDRAILAARRNGEAWKQIADRFDLSERQARRAAKSAEQLESEYDLDQVDGMKTLGRIIAAQARALDTVEVEMSAGDNGSARIGAARAAGSIGSDRT